MLPDLINKLNQSGQRGFLWLTGSQRASRAWLAMQVQDLTGIDKQSVVFFGNGELNHEPNRENAESRSTAVPSAIVNPSNHTNQWHDARVKHFRRYLGQENQLIIYDAYDGFNPDAIGALVGTIKMGGLFILISPAASQWRQYDDPELQRVCVEGTNHKDLNNNYLHRLCSLLSISSNIFHIDLERGLTASFNGHDFSHASPTVNLLPKKDVDKPELFEFGCKTVDQLNAVNTILFASLNPERLQLDGKSQAWVIEADRGRGKSITLAILIAEIINAKLDKAGSPEVGGDQRQLEIVITCPLVDSVSGLLAFLVDRLNSKAIRVNLDKNQLTGSVSNREVEYAWRVRFLPPDQSVAEFKKANFVFIDEAAAIPQTLLHSILAASHFAVLATTAHGYEGTGRGFEYKLKPLLGNYFQHQHVLNMTVPIRWRNDDHLEQIVHQLLALDVELPDLPAHIPQDKHALLQSCIVSKVERQPNWAESTECQQIFAIMMHAHYRTSPNDFRILLDGPNIEIWQIKYSGVVVGAAMVALEGELPLELNLEIARGRRRPRGHLFPQSLMCHNGMVDAGQFRYGRIVRIAIHPALQHLGLGSKLLEEVERSLSAQGVDIMCTSFGLSEAVVNFWQKNGLRSLRLGVKPDASSGETSILMAKPLTERVTSFYNHAAIRFWQTMLIEQQVFNKWNLVSQWLSPPSLKQLEVDNTFTKQDWQDLEFVGHHFRLPENAILALHKLARNTASVSQQKDVLSMWLLDKEEKNHVMSLLNITSEKQWVARIRETVRARLQMLGANTTTSNTQSH